MDGFDGFGLPGLTLEPFEGRTELPGAADVLAGFTPPVVGVPEGWPVTFVPLSVDCCIGALPFMPELG